MKLYDLIGRFFYYFRIAYATYLGLLLGVISFLTTTYYLAIQNIPFLKGVFPGFIEFSIVTFFIVTPFGIGLGWWHLKHSPFYRSEQEIGVEANPYLNKKLSPVTIPSNILFEALLRERGMIKEADALRDMINNSNVDYTLEKDKVEK